MKSFRELLQDGIVVFDGATGTRLDEVGVGQDCKVEWNVSHPDAVRSVHRSYVEAGAQVVSTNTFAGNGLQLEKAGYGGRVAELCAAAVGVAREAAGDQALVAASLGPTGGILEPLGALSAAQAEEAFAQQLEAQVAAGIDLILLETFGSLEEVEVAARAARAAGPDLPLVGTMSFDTGDRTMFGVDGTTAAQRLAELGCEVVGANCAYGEGMLAAVAQMAEAVDLPVLVQPNAGRPELVDGATTFPASPADLAEEALKFKAAGATLFGACCGSTAAHIRAIADAVR
ncbi:MAG: homocysteine S-methyltransferase family protein [Armatimonadota bacterium]